VPILAIGSPEACPTLRAISIPYSIGHLEDSKPIAKAFSFEPSNCEYSKWTQGEASLMENENRTAGAGEDTGSTVSPLSTRDRRRGTELR
jgi:hypothetical protein